jgi:tetratricopeptide (TPR) repeat protein
VDDELVSGVWELDPDTRSELRLNRIRTAVQQGDWPGAVIEAEELLDEEPDHAETLGLLANALLELGDAETAAEAFEDHLKQAPPDPIMLSGLAIARFESCDVVGALEAAREALRLDAGLAEAHYTLGLALDRTGDAASATQSLAAARSLDPIAYPFPIELPDADLQAALDAALAALPAPLQRFWNGVPVQVESEPDLAELTARPPPLPPTVAGLYAGHPPDDDTALAARPTALRLFRKNLARCGSLDQVAEQLLQVLEHEALDWLGVPLEELEALQAAPGSR